MSAQMEKLQRENDELRYEVRAIRGDRDNVLKRVLILQEENTMLKVQISDMEIEIKHLKAANAAKGDAVAPGGIVIDAEAG